MLKKFAEGFKEHEPLITAIINLATALIIMYNAAH